MLICRRCNSDRLLELARLDGEDHTVYRCLECGFLFSPPEGHAGGANVVPAAAPDNPEEARRRMASVASVRRRPLRDASRDPVQREPVPRDPVQ